MAEPVTLTFRDFDAWHLASPLQLLHLIKRLGVEGTVIAEWLGVTPAAVSQWNRGRRDIPLRYGPGLRVWAEKTLQDAEQRTRKEMDRQPTSELRDAVWTEFATIWHRWKLEVLFQAGTIRKAIQQDYQTLGQVLTKDPITREDRELIPLIMESLLRNVDQMLLFQPEAPSAEEALLQRLTQAHEQAARERQREAKED